MTSNMGEVIAILCFAAGAGLLLFDLWRRDSIRRRPVEPPATLCSAPPPVAPAPGPDRESLLEMIRHARTDEERERWRLLLIEVDLEKYARQGLRTVQLTAGPAKERLCPVCRALDQSIISVHAGARAIMPADCTCKTKGLLWPSGWIKRPDGSGYIDRPR